jgi:RNA polymerase sigma-70 factor (ECF subfamily)
MSARQPSDPETWVDQHGDFLYRYALLRLRDPAVAEDVVQETFLAALQARHHFAGQSSEKTWLVGILKHKIIDYFRKVNRERSTSAMEALPDDPEDLFVNSGEWMGHWDLDRQREPIEWGADPSQVLEHMEFWMILERCLSGLPARTASAFSLREMEELSSEEVCKVLNITATNLWVMLHRARAHLRHCLEANWFGQEIGEQ